MLIGALAIAGIPPLAGFFSKDEILGGAFKIGFYGSGSSASSVAVMTGFYMFRLMGKTFYGESHVDPHVEPKIHESPWTMTLPLILLAIPSLILGIVPPGRPAARPERPACSTVARAHLRGTPRRNLGIVERPFELPASTAC